MARKNNESMQNKVEKSESVPDNSGVPKGEQMALLNTLPEHSKEILRLARAYLAKIKARMEIQNGENGELSLQQQLLALVKSENITRDNDGKIKFTIDSIEIELVPTKEKVKVTIVD